MIKARLLSPAHYRTDQLAPWLLLSLLIHLAILFLLGVWSLVQQVKNSHIEELEIVLTPKQHSTPTAQDSRILSQHRQAGEKRALPPTPPDSSNTADPGKDLRQQAAQEAVQVLPSALPKNRRGQFLDSPDQRLAEQQAQQAMHQPNPLREKVINSATREYRYAAYMDTWRRRVESVGNRHYLRNASARGLAGRLILDVAVTAEGAVHAIEIQKSSGNAALDRTALDIVRMAAPFKPFPARIREDTDILHIVRTWNFSGSQMR